jgi:hypothetical protein
MMRFLEVGEEQAFHELAAECGFVFASLPWLTATGAKPCGIYDAGGRLTGGAVLSVTRNLGITGIRTPLFCPNIGPFLTMEASHPVKVRETRRRALADLVEFLRAQRPAVQSIALDRQFQDVLPFVWAGYMTRPGYTYLLDLRAEPDAWFARFSPKRRSELRKAEKDGLVSGETRDLETVLRLVDMTYARQDKSYHRARLRALLEGLAPRPDWFATVTKDATGPLSAAFCLHSRDTAYYLFGGYDSSRRNAQAGPATLWQALRVARGRGLSWFDFEGSSLPAIERFYSDFGGELTGFFKLTRAWLPLEMGLKLVRRGSF